MSQYIIGLGHVRTRYFDIGDEVWIDGKTKGHVEHCFEGEHIVVTLERGFFAHTLNHASSMDVPGYDTFISSMVVHVSNLATSEGGDRPFKDVP